MIIRKLLLQSVSFALVAAYGVLLTVAQAESTVLGQLHPQGSVTLNPGAPTEYVLTSETPYISGDVVSTLGGKGASLVSSNGDVVTLSADSRLAVDGLAPVSVTLIEGAFKFTSGANATTNIATPSGNFRVKSDMPAEGIAIYQNGEFAIKSLSGSFIVENDIDSAVAKVDQQNAFIYADGLARTVDVIAGGNGIIIGLLAAAAVIAGIIIAADDNSPTSP